WAGIATGSRPSRTCGSSRTNGGDNRSTGSTSSCCSMMAPAGQSFSIAKVPPGMPRTT
ncbi:MAG: hypothetical protein AVDCRST_MAG43-2223, partial [uncultured Thermomicrobiales bacterium]